MRFFYAIASISEGEFQKANDMIFTLFKLAYYSRDDIKGLSIILGLTAWSNSNYKMGEEVESMIAIIAAIDIAIENKEVIYPFMFGFKNVIDFLYNHAFMFSLDKEHQDALHELVNNSANELLESKYYFIIGKYDYIIENRLELFKQNELIWNKRPELEIVFNLKENEEEFFANELKVLIDAYYKKGLVEEACFYIYKYKTSLVINLFERIDVSYRLFYEWAKILLENNDYHLSQEFILLSIGHIEKLRTVFHKRERSFIGKQANKIYRTYLEILCRQNISCKSNEINSLSDSLLIRDVLINMVPRSIIEQKLFNQDSLVSDELVKVNRRYYDLFFIINNMQQNGNMDENYKTHLSEFMQCKKYLEENHPFFRSLPFYDKLNRNLSADKYEAIRTKLQDDELFYQIVLVDNLLLYNIISKDNNEINVEMIDLDAYKEMFEKFKQNIMLDDFYLCKNESNVSFVKLCDNLSSIFTKPLHKYLDKNKYKKLYFMPDLSLTYISMNYMRYKNYWFIQLFDSIENIIDFNNIVSKSSYDYGNKTIAHFVNKQDKSISKIYNMIKSQKDVEIEESDELNIEINQPLKSWILVGHGISEIRGFNYIGAKSIKKSKKININLDEYLSIKSKVENALIISCSSGTLINDYAERNNGVWSSLLEKNISYILYCKWDVSIEYTKRLLEIILDKMRASKIVSLSEALASAQKEMCSEHPILWAGLEVWKNE
jgi:CHAT domain-containing protein